jgi:hypothetical protein
MQGRTVSRRAKPNPGGSFIGKLLNSVCRKSPLLNKLRSFRARQVSQTAVCRLLSGKGTATMCATMNSIRRIYYESISFLAMVSTPNFNFLNGGTIVEGSPATIASASQTFCFPDTCPLGSVASIEDTPENTTFLDTVSATQVGRTPA